MKTRKANRAKQVCNSCRNNGSCTYCVGSRTHCNRRAEPIEQDDPSPIHNETHTPQHLCD